MQNADIAKILNEIAQMLEVTGANFYRVRAYYNASRTVADQTTDLASLSIKELAEIPGIGKDLATKIDELNRTGDTDVLRELRKQVPAGMIEMLNLPGLGPKRVKQLADELRIKSIADLKKALDSGALESVRGFGPKMEEKLRESIAHKAEAPAPVRWTYADAAVEADALVKHLRKSRAVDQIEVAGSFRRKRDTVGDLDILVTSDDPSAVMKRFLDYPKIEKVLGTGESKTNVTLTGGFQVDVRVVPRESYGAAMQYFTGSKAHGIHVRRIAQKMGLSLSEYGLFRDGKSIAGKTEEEIYAKLGLKWVPPELREDRGEVEAAAEGRLPKLIERDDLLGDLHTHTTYTDGRASVEEMAHAAEKAGLKYFAITDHSQRLAMVFGLDKAKLAKQAREIEGVQAHLRKARILRGIECDIMEDGTLDLDDDTLAGLDWVVASVHYKLDQSARDMTRRLIKAIRNRNVDVIGHPSGRLINRREASGFDLDEVLHVAHEEGCAMEINSQPDRLDLIDTACLAAKRAGVKLVISSDSHSTAQFGCLALGVNQARRGWIEAKDVLNTRPLRELRVRR
ncbi:MAG TPA: DNA polymerase/3'-5' exonuclease PolX [Candidatus Binataceae bacterium]|nr:DNA polymerase/3'-5' exonuclease PolX [Candidatus Binataceae bacterium]